MVEHAKSHTAGLILEKESFVRGFPCKFYATKISSYTEQSAKYNSVWVILSTINFNNTSSSERREMLHILLTE